jgi:hypothetical protein
MTLRILAVLVIAGHWLVAVWHLFWVARIPGVTDTTVNWLAIGLATFLHFAVSLAVWKLSDKVSGSLLFGFLLVVLGFDIYEHFLGPGPNNVFRVAPGEWTAAFQISVYLLVFLELLGCWLGIRILTAKNRTEAVREALQRR